MRIVFTSEGGLAFFPSLSMPAVINSHDLSEPRRPSWSGCSILHASSTWPQDSRALHCGAADYRQYTITVEKGRRRHTVLLMDPVENPQLQMLLDLLRRHAQRPATHGMGTASELTHG